MAYDDSTMEYNSSAHRYVLTEDYCRDVLGEDLRLLNANGANIDNLANQYLNRVSRTVYNYIYAHSNYYEYLEYYLAMQDSARNIIKDAMSEQLLYQLANGDLTVMSGVNKATNSAIPRKDMKGAMFAPQLDSILDRDREILYNGQRNFITDIPTYEEGGY